MKAVFIEKFGGREVLTFGELPAPQVGPEEILVKVAYAGTNPVDYKIREGLLADALPHEFPLVPGWDVAGEVVEVGEEVTAFKPGDRIFAYTRKAAIQAGSYAEYMTVTEDMAALVPSNITLAQAAAVPLAALTAWQALFENLKVRGGQTILIHAGAGGVGSFAIQLAKQCGCQVITTASSEKHAYVKELGADEVIDYQTKDWASVVKTAYPAGIDAVFDTVGGESLRKSYALLKDGGSLVSVVEVPAPEGDDAKRLRRADYMFVRPEAQQLTAIARLISKEKLRLPALDVVPLADAAEAHERLEGRHVTGKIVLQVH